MLKVTTNRRKNRLTIVLHQWRRADIPGYVEQIESACSSLLPGFDCLALCRRNRRLTARDRELLLKTGDLISAYGVGRVIWVSQNPSGCKQRQLQAGTVSIPIETAPDVKSAQSRLQSRPA